MNTHLTTHSTGALDSVPFIIFPCGVNCVLLARARSMRALGACLILEVKIMRTMFIALILVSLSLNFPSISLAKEWRGIVPIHSKRADVERLLGKGTDYCCFTEYSLEDVRVVVMYSSGNCDSKGWNVPKDTVISLEVYLSVKPRVSDLQIDESKFQITEDPELPGIFQYDNEEEGFTIVVGKGMTRGFYYMAASKDKHLRCNQRRT
jgi:hypothetical protein